MTYYLVSITPFFYPKRLVVVNHTPIFPLPHIINKANSRVNEDSILAVQVFDQRKFKKKDQGFLGVINVRIGDALPELTLDMDG